MSAIEQNQTNRRESPVTNIPVARLIYRNATVQN